MSAVALGSAPQAQETLGTWVGRLAPNRMPALGLLGDTASASHAHAGSHVALFDGVLYNRAELLATLGEPPETPDAALVLSAYRRWGVEVLDKLKGLFALAIWDGDAGRALLAHDPFAMYPLFYAEAGDQLLFSSSIDSLLACDGVSKTVDRAVLADHLCHRWPNREATYFEAVRRIPPCHALIVERGTRRLHRYWDPAPPGEPVDWVREDELDRFGELFDQAVSRALDLGPVGIFLSGGFDSVSVAAVAADNCRKQGMPAPLALSVAFPHPDCNEEDVQRAVARTLGLDQLMQDMGDAVQPHGLLKASCLLQEGRSQPMLSYFAPPYLQLAHAAKARGYNAVLTGGGGDEWLCVTPLVAADLIRRGDIRGLIRHARSMQRSFNLPARAVWKNALWVFGMRQLLGAATGSALRRVAPGRLDAHRRGIVRGQVHDWVAPDGGLRDQMEQRNVEGWPERPTDGWYLHDLRNGLDHAVTAMEMEEFFENTRITGVRTLCPFMDPDLVDFLYRVPPELLDRGGRAKGLVRHEIARRFPGLGFERQKKLTAVSYSRSVVLKDGEQAWRESGAPALAELGVIDEKAFEQKLQAILAGSDEGVFHVSDVLNLEAWTRTRI